MPNQRHKEGKEKPLMTLIAEIVSIIAGITSIIEFIKNLF